MDYLNLLLLSTIQGIAEFLPISSSGHLVLAGHWLGIKEAQGTLNIMLHAGTLLSIIVFYFRRIILLVYQDQRIIPLLIVGTIPGAVIGFAIKKYGAWIIESPWLAAAMLIVTGLILLSSRWIVREHPIDYRDAGWRIAIGVGLAQALAILPGISRSGSTICAGLFLGLKRESAGTFSFLLAIPIIAGATGYEIKQVMEADSGTGHGPFFLLTGALISFVVGYFALYWLTQFIERGKFHLFAWWCIPFGIFSLLMLALFG